MDPTSFESLLKVKNCNSSERWYPTSVEGFKFALKINRSIENSDALLSNLAYSLQYLEFLEKEFTELNVSSVIYVMLVKTYVITGMSVLEGLFSNIVKSNGWWKNSSLESLGTTQSNKTNFSGNQYVVITEILQEVDSYPLPMTLDELIKVLNHHHTALQVSHLVYPALKRLKDLRNRIHLQKTTGSSDHDYNAFDFSVKKEMGDILYQILTSPMITAYPQRFEFLKRNSEANYTHD